MDKPKLHAITGNRDVVERDLANALFTPDANGVDGMIKTLQPKGNLKLAGQVEAEPSVPHRSGE